MIIVIIVVIVTGRQHENHIKINKEGFSNKNVSSVYQNCSEVILLCCYDIMTSVSEKTFFTVFSVILW